MPVTNNYTPNPIHTQLGEEFYDAVKPASFPKHILRFKNLDWARVIGLDRLNEEEWIRHFSKFEPLPGNLTQALALRYHGHQFQHYNPDLGDGRGFLFAQIKESSAPYRTLDLGTKGSGQTPYSRQGDGRLTLKGAVREILATEMLEAQGVNTSKTFSVIETGEALERHDEPSPTRSAVLVRLSHSHIRFGSFQRFAFLEQPENIRKLVHHSLRHYFQWVPSDEGDVFLRFFAEVVKASARLCAQWMVSGFVHGVLNTDNLVVTGESFDYGPYRFLPHYDPQFTAAYFDREGLYAYARQPESVYWNLHQLGHALSFAEAEMNDYIDLIQEHYASTLDEHLLSSFLRRLNLNSNSKDQDRNLLKSTYDFLRISKVGYDDFFFDWNGGVASRSWAMQSPRQNSYQGDGFASLMQQLETYTLADSQLHLQLRKDWREPQSLLIDEIESLWQSIDKHDDWNPLEDKIRRVRKWKQLWNKRL